MKRPLPPELVIIAQVGMGTALEWCLTGEMVTADRAVARGLVRSLHEPGELMDAAHALASAIATKSAPVSAAVTRHMLWRLSALDHPRTAHLIESKLGRQRLQSADMKEGVASFFEKRPAVWPQDGDPPAPDLDGEARCGRKRDDDARHDRGEDQRRQSRPDHASRPCITVDFR